MLKAEQVDGLLATVPGVDGSEFSPELKNHLAAVTASLASLGDLLRETEDDE